MSKSKRFHLGKVVISQGVQERIPAEEITAALERHRRGDWGDISQAGKRVNDWCYKKGYMLLSVYNSKFQEDTTFWVMTHDRRYETLMLLPEES